MPLNLSPLALEVIGLVDRGAHLQAALDKVVTHTGSRPCESAALADLVYGFFRHRLTLSWVLKRFLKNPEKLPPQMLLLLELALASLLYQDKKADFAVVSELVELVKKRFGKSLAGVANGVLRNLLRHSKEIQNLEWFQAEIGDTLAGAAVYYGLPLVVARLWTGAYGLEAAFQLMARSAERPWKGVLLNSKSPLAAGIRSAFMQFDQGKVAPVGKWGFAIAPGLETGEICGASLAELARAGNISLLAAGSQQVLWELGLHQWQRPVWDCCAGAGGKTNALLNMGVNVALASDVSAKRGATFKRLAANRGGAAPVFCRMDVLRPALKRWQGDVVADVPCSGLGVLARRPDLRKIAGNFSASLASHAETQRQILTGLLSMLEPGGRLAYVTCTLNPAENSENIDKVLRSFPTLTLEREWQTPHGHPWLEGMYGAVLRA